MSTGMSKSVRVKGLLFTQVQTKPVQMCLSPQQHHITSCTDVREYLLNIFVQNHNNRVVCSHQFEDVVVSQSVSKDHYGVLRAAAGTLPHSEAQGVCAGTKPQHAAAVRPHTPHTWNRTDNRTWRTDEEKEKRQTHPQIK